jgi:uncharacterized protein (DUF1786 family)
MGYGLLSNLGEHANIPFFHRHAPTVFIRMTGVSALEMAIMTETTALIFDKVYASVDLSDC